MSSALFLYLFQYIGLGAIFFVGLAYAWRQGDVGFKAGAPRRNLVGLLGGLVVYMAVHALFQFVMVGI